MANHSFQQKLADDPLQRHGTTIDLPQINERGVYVVEFIGGGKRLRTIIHKGGLKSLQRISGAGHIFAVLDESDQPVPAAYLILNDRVFQADESGIIQLPYASTAGSKSVIISDGQTAIKQTFNHHGEEYAFETGFHVERDALVAGKEAQLLIRPRLTIHNQTVDLSALENVSITITAINGQGISSSETIPEVSFQHAETYSHNFRVPNDLRTLQVSVNAQIERVSDGSKQDLSTVDERRVNSLRRTTQIAAPHLARSAEGWILSIRGQGGEVLPHHICSLSFQHRLGTQPLTEQLQSDKDGRIFLGNLSDIRHITVTPQGINGQTSSYQYHITSDSVAPPVEIHLASGGRLELAWPEGPDALTAERISFFALRGGVPRKDMRESLRAQDGLLRADNLPDGTYSFIRRDMDRETTIVIGGQQSTWSLLKQVRFSASKVLRPSRCRKPSGKGKNCTPHCTVLTATPAFTYLPAFSSPNLTRKAPSPWATVCCFAATYRPRKTTIHKPFVWAMRNVIF